MPGHMLMSNGEAIAAGGTTVQTTRRGRAPRRSTPSTSNRELQEATEHVDGRWYPSVVNTRGGYALIVGGFDASGSELGDV